MGFLGRCRGDPVGLLGPLLVGLALAAVWTALEASDRQKLKKRKSAAGGFEISVPESWSLTEIAGEQTYEGAVTPDAVDSPTAEVRSGSRIRRSRDFTDLFHIDPRNFDASSFTYATAVAQEITREGQTIISSGSWRAAGARRSTRYLLDIGLRSPECSRAFMEIRIYGKEGFLAFGRMPCSDPEKEWVDLPEDAPEELLLEIGRSLWVGRKWGEAPRR